MSEATSETPRECSEQAPPPVVLQPGAVLAARYQLMRPLGAGTVGELWLAIDLRGRGEVAVKVLHARHLGNADLRGRFETEARTAAALLHPCIVEVLGFGQLADHRPFLVTEYVAGSTLEAVACGIALGTRQVVPIAECVAEGLARAHDVGIVHRDLKPSNVLVSMSRSGAPLIKISDFGLARPSGTSLSGASLVGTPRYMAPELLTAGEYTPRTDLYALGCVLFEMLSGSPCLDVDSFEEVPQALARRGPVDLAARVPDCPPALVRLVNALMEPDPARRPLDAHAVVRALRELRAPAGHTEAPTVMIPVTAPASVPASVPASAPAHKGPRMPAIPMIKPPLHPPVFSQAEPAQPDKRVLSPVVSVVSQHAIAPRSALARWTLRGEALDALSARVPAGDGAAELVDLARRRTHEARAPLEALAQHIAALEVELRGLEYELRRARERTGITAAEFGADLSRTRARVVPLEQRLGALEPGLAAAREGLQSAWLALTQTPGASVPLVPSKALTVALEIAARAGASWRAADDERAELEALAQQFTEHALVLEQQLDALRSNHALHEAHLGALREQLEGELLALESEVRALDERLCTTVRAALEPLRGRDELATPLASMDAALVGAPGVSPHG